MEHLPRLGKTRLRFAVGPEAQGIKQCFQQMHRMGALNAPAHFEPHIKKSLGLKGSAAVGACKLADCMALFKTDEDNNKVLLGMVHAGDINCSSTASTSDAPVSVWRVHHREQMGRALVMPDTSSEMQQRASDLVITPAMTCSDVLAQLRDHADLLHEAFPSDDEEQDVEPCTAEEYHMNEIHNAESEDEVSETSEQYNEEYDSQEEGDHAHTSNLYVEGGSDTEEASDEESDTSMPETRARLSVDQLEELPQGHLGDLSSNASFSDGDGHENLSMAHALQAVEAEGVLSETSSESDFHDSDSSSESDSD
eukprot:3375336-Rhodomonas_salina.2